MSVIRDILAPLGRASTYRALAYLLSGLPLGVAWLTILLTGWTLGLGLSITLVGLPILLGMAYATMLLADVERGLVRSLLDTPLVATRRTLRGGLIARLRDWARDPAAWRELAYVAVRATGGLALGIAVLALVASTLRLVAYPAYGWTSGLRDLGGVDWDSPLVVVLATLGGLLLLPAVAWAVVGLGRLNAAVATALLGRVPGRPPVPDAVRRAGRRRLLVLHASVAAALTILMVGIWGASTPGGYFWPAWVGIGLSIPLGVNALAVLVPDVPGPRGLSLRPLLVSGSIALLVFVELVLIWTLTTPGGYFWPAWALLGLALPVAAHALWIAIPGRPARRALLTHAGASALLMLVMVLIWAGTTPGGYFWPAWVMLGLAVPLAIHAVAFAVTDRGDEQLAERVEVLTSTRAAAVDAQAAELRRIERDLHDGAQARLTALAMDLGMARERLSVERDGDAATLVASAHEEAKRALVELRDLARGIHPAVLTDRGLDAALSALATSSSMPVDVSVRAPGRLPAAVEGAAYFVVAESIANAHKHSAASAIEVVLERTGDTLLVRVADDGVGGADPAGAGLDGLRRRIEALDGRLWVESTADDGTTIQAEIPCGS